MNELAKVWLSHDTVLCQRPFLSLAPTFEFFDPDGKALLFCKAKVFAIKDDIRMFSDASQQTEVLRIKQRNILEAAGVFDLFDSATDQKVGVLRRHLGGYFGGYTWSLLDANDQPLGLIEETGGKLWRRLFKLLPYSFAFRLGEQEVGTFTQHFSLFRYKATLDLSAARGTPFDRRLAFAGALLLMAVEAKQDQR